MIEVTVMPHSQGIRLDLASRIARMRLEQGLSEIPHLTKMGHDRLVKKYRMEFSNYTQFKTNKENEMSAKKKAANPEINPEQTKAEETKVSDLVITDRMALETVAKVAGWEPGDPDISAMDDEACTKELQENMDILTPEDKSVVEGLENGAAIWAYLASKREDLSKAKITATKEEKKAVVKETAPKKKAAVKRTEVNPGVISSIQEFITGAGKAGISAQGIADKLAERFPDRDVEGMKKTIKAQVPGRMGREKGIKISTKQDGDTVLFFIA